MNSLKTIAHSVTAAALSIVPLGGGGKSMRDERQRIKTAEQAQEFHAKLVDLFGVLPGGPQRDVVQRQRDATLALLQQLRHAEEHERLKKVLSADLRAAQSEIDAARVAAAEADAERSRLDAALSELDRRMRPLQATEGQHQRDAVQRQADARAELEAAVAAGDEDREAQAAAAVAQAEHALNAVRPLAVRLAAMARERDQVEASLADIVDGLGAKHRAVMVCTASWHRLKVNAAMVEATFARAAWRSAAQAAGLGFYDSPPNPFDTELRYDLPALPHQVQVPWNAPMLLLDDAAFDLEASAAEQPQGSSAVGADRPRSMPANGARVRIGVGA